MKTPYLKVVWEKLKKPGFWRSDVGKALKVTILGLLIAGCMYLLGNPLLPVLRLNFSLLPFATLGITIGLLFLVVSFFAVAISEIKLAPKQKTVAIDYHDSAYRLGVISLAAGAGVQLLSSAVNKVAPLLASYMTLEAWQVVLWLIGLVIVVKLLRKGNALSGYRNDKGQ